MDLLEKASIILTPTAYNNGEALCVKPDDASGDFDFSRNSAATRVNAQGLVENVQILSGNLVQNGDFSEEGAEEVSNGSFSQEGVQLITNGSFDTDSGWIKQTPNWTISNGYAVCDGLQTTNSSLFQDLAVVNGNNYRIDFTITDSANDLNLILGATTIGQYGNGTHTIYVKKDSGGARIFFQATSSNNFQGSIDNVSVKEVGQDWVFSAQSELTEQGARIYSNDGSYQYIVQNSILTIGKQYKLTFDVVSTNGASLANGSGTFVYDTTTVGNKTFYIEADSAELGIKRLSGVTDVTITNISVKEVGQNWDILNDVTSFSFNNGIANIQGTANSANNGIKQASISAVIGKTYKISATLRSNDGGLYRFRLLDGSYFDLGNGNSAEFETITSYHTATSTAFTIFATSWFTNGTSNFDITNISVIEITDDTNLPRINYEGFSYQDALGSEEIVNGTFDTDSDWVKGTGWSISGGSANCDGTQTSLSFLIQNGQVQSGKTYKVTYDVTSYTSGEIIAFIGGSQGQTITSVGTYTEYLTTSNTNFWLRANSDFIGSIDNVSVKEYLGQEPIPNSGCGHWLWEPQSTNIITQSGTFSDWLNLGGRSQTTINDVISPDGTQNASKLEQIVAAGDASIRFTGLTAGVEYTFSLYAKKGNFDEMQLDISDILTFFTLTDNWVRYEITETATSNFVDVGIKNGVVGSYFYIWGAQVEQQSYATSYIPTSGTSVTRNQDLCTNGGSLASINSTEGVLYAEIAALANENVQRILSVSDGTHNNTVKLGFANNTTDYRFFADIRVGGVNQAFLTYNFGAVAPTFKKCAIKYKENDFALWIDGVEVATDTSGNTPIGLNELSFTRGDTAQNFFGKTKALAVFPYLSDEELIELTTI